MNTTAIASQFKQVCTEVADAIREKKGSTDKILPKDFSSEIRNISGGGAVKSYYYRLKEPTVIKDSVELQILLSSVIFSSHFILKSDKNNILNDGGSSLTGTTYPTVAIMFYDVPYYTPANRGNYEYCAKLVGDWANRLIILMSLFGNEISYDDAVAQINQYFEPITEEEFFNLVDIEIE